MRWQLTVQEHRGLRNGVGVGSGCGRAIAEEIDG